LSFLCQIIDSNESRLLHATAALLIISLLSIIAGAALLRDRIAFGPKRKRWKRQICWWNDYDGFRRWAFALVGASLSNGETLITMFQSHQQKALRKAERMVKRMLLKGSYF